MRIKMVISYNGCNYSGWQKQKNALSVQQVLEEHLSSLLGKETAVTASGRTDEGVHALGQVVHFDAETSIPAEKICLALNSVLPKDIRCISSECVSGDFSARYSAKKKTYLYKFYTGNVENPTKLGLETFVKGELDLNKMKTCMSALVGIHDFNAFKATNSSAKTSVREIYDVSLEKNGNEFTFKITGNGFLYNMVRIIVGTLIEVGQGKKDIRQIEKALLSKERKDAGKTAPPDGLYLLSVEYL